MTETFKTPSSDLSPAQQDLLDVIFSQFGALPLWKTNRYPPARNEEPKVKENLNSAIVKEIRDHLSPLWTMHECLARGKVHIAIRVHGPGDEEKHFEVKVVGEVRPTPPTSGYEIGDQDAILVDDKVLELCDRISRSFGNIKASYS